MNKPGTARAKRSVKKPRADRPSPARISGDVPEASTSQGYVFRLFISGGTEISSRALRNIKDICEKHFAGKYQLDVVDVYQQPQLAKGEQIIAVPTLVKKSPGRTRKILGDIKNAKEFIKKLD